MILAQKTDRTPSSYWLVQPGSIHESLVQLSLGDRVEKYHAWLPPVLSFYQSHPASHPNPTAKKGKRLARALFISLVKSSFGSLKTKEMDKKRGGLMQRAMPPKPTEVRLTSADISYGSLSSLKLFLWGFLFFFIWFYST